MNFLKKAIRQFFLALISAYQKVISPLLPSSCRFYPSCSEYARLCFKNLPLSKAFFLSLRRILRCHPGQIGGIDMPPIPKKD